MKTKLESILEFLYSEEQNIEIYSFFDKGWSFRLGDESNGFTGSGDGYWTLDDLADGITDTYYGLK